MKALDPAVPPHRRGVYGHAADDGRNLFRHVVHAWGAQMSAWIATALAVAITAMSAITAVKAGPCTPGSTRNCFNIPATIDFGSVPEISKQIVSEENTDQKQKHPTSPPATPDTYTRPTFRARHRPRQTPAVVNFK